MKEGISRRDFLGLTAMAAGAAVTAEVATLFSKPETVSAQVSDWPQTPEAAANRWKGLAAKWKLTERQLRNPAIGVDSFTMQEWRYTEKTPPFPWPTTPEEAAKAFGLPIVGGLEADKFMPAWKEEDSGRVTGWHYKEDGHGDVMLILPKDCVLEGYTAGETIEPKDDRAVVVFGADSLPGAVIQVVSIPKLQGFTIWEPGTEPNSVALRMGIYTASSDHPHYMGPNGEQLGPDAIGFKPVYRAPK